jgi:hypothetical protein
MLLLRFHAYFPKDVKLYDRIISCPKDYFRLRLETFIAMIKVGQVSNCAAVPDLWASEIQLMSSAIEELECNDCGLSCDT